MYFGLMYLIRQDYITSPMLLRYLQGHAISLVTLAMFFVGIASLILIFKNVVEQFRSARQISLQPTTESDDTVVEIRQPSILVEQCQQQLLSFPNQWHQHYLYKQLRQIVDIIQHSDSTAGVEEELKYLHDLDVSAQQQRYSLVRILIWATPMLGFLGTVLGISEALGGMNVGANVDFQSMMDGLRSNLYVAFDTTALALTLSMVLMFVLFLVERFESNLLVLVSQRARSEIVAIFDLTEDRSELKQLTEAIIQASQQSVEKQIELWKRTIANAEAAWVSSLSQTNEMVQSNLSNALEDNINDLSHYLGEAISKTDDSIQHRLQQWQVTLSSNARRIEEQQKVLSEQSKHLESMIQKEETRSEWSNALTQHKEAIASTLKLKSALEGLNQSILQHQETGLELAQRLHEQEQNARPVPRPIDLLISQTKSSPGSSDKEVVVLPTDNVLTKPAQVACSNGLDESGEVDETPAQTKPPVILKFPQVDNAEREHSDQRMREAIQKSNQVLSRRRAA